MRPRVISRASSTLSLAQPVIAILLRKAVYEALGHLRFPQYADLALLAFSM